ncbi:MAG: bifunctional DNA primase/polymerase [Pseudomonadota bacterium]
MTAASPIKPHVGSSKIASALDLAAQDFHIFPLRPDSKLPAIKDFSSQATREEARIRAWWTQSPEANIGISTSHGLLVVDVDNKNTKNGSDEILRLEMQGLDLPPTFTQRTPTGGLHLVYRVDEPIKQGANILAPGLDIRSRGGYIVGAGSTIGEGIYEVVEGPPPRPAPSWLVERCGRAQEKTRQAAQPAIESIDSPAILQRAARYLQQEAPLAIEGQGGDETTYKVACRLKDMGCSQASALMLLDLHWNERCSPPWDPDELAGKVANVYRYGREAIGSKAPEAEFEPLTEADAAKPQGKPTIKIKGGDLSALADEAERVLIEARMPIYQRGGELVRPVVDDIDAAHGGKTKAARTVPVTEPTLLDWLDKAAGWARYARREKEWRWVNPPREVATILLSRDGAWRAPHLAGVITTPTLRPDGSLLSKPGYDAATRLLLLDPPAMPELPPRPSKADAETALALLDDLLVEFPFADPPSRSVALSGLITPVVRGALRVAPLHAARAPSAGTGKSYLWDVMAAIATGQRCPTLAAGKSEEETAKRLEAALLAGRPIVSIDNLNGDLSGETLCQHITQSLLEIRPLGRSAIVRVENRVCIFATGNNLRVVGDMVRRALVCDLDANAERPELREYRRHPVEMVLADRGRYVAACLTIARAYLTAGRPSLLRPLAGFEDWSRLVRSALVWLGRADPADTIEKARQDDPETTGIQQLIAAWRDIVGVDRPLTAGDIIEAAEQAASPMDGKGDISLLEAIRSAAGVRRQGALATDSREFGKWLGRRKGRIACGLKIIASRESHGKQALWGLTMV